jgi:hypothetical protein
VVRPTVQNTQPSPNIAMSTSSVVRDGPIAPQQHALGTSVNPNRTAG